MKKLEIKYIPINDIKPYKNNPRLNEDAIPYVMKSIREFGFKNPIILDKNNVIVAGHTRLESAKRLGMKEAPVIYADDLTEEQVKAFRLVDNKVSEKSMWDYTKLDEELDSILDIDMSIFDFNITGINWDSIEELNEEVYEEPQKDLLMYPKCSHIDSKEHFKKVNSYEDNKKIEIKDYLICEANLEDIDGIKKIADKNANEIGFVLRPALEEHCKKGSLLVAKDKDKIIGFCNYNKRNDGVNIIYEICNDFKYRGNGIAKAMIEKIERPIQLKCPIDNESNNFYKHYGFNLVEIEDGKKRKLNIWRLD